MHRIDLEEIATILVDRSLYIHKELGPGLFESAYEEVLTRELQLSGLIVKRQERIPLNWKGEILDKGYVCDLLIEDEVIVELKSVEQILPLHKKQVITYLKLSERRLGFLINFNVNLMKNGITRLVNNL